MNLFPDLPASPSPYLLFRQRYNIHVRYVNADDEGLMPYTASIGTLEKVADENNVGHGCTEKSAVMALAKRLNLGGWQELNWED